MIDSKYSACVRDVFGHIAFSTNTSVQLGLTNRDWLYKDLLHTIDPVRLVAALCDGLDRQHDSTREPGMSGFPCDRLARYLGVDANTWDVLAERYPLARSGDDITGLEILMHSDLGLVEIYKLDGFMPRQFAAHV